jgi:diguanylate cyclase (GGDEF)-like protein/PAS domain S-box-containing protein
MERGTTGRGAFGAAAEEGAQTEHLFRSLLSSVGEGIVVWDTDLRFRIWNPFMEDLTGYFAAEVLGRKLPELFPTMHRAASIVRRALSGQIVRSPDLRYQHRTGGNGGWISGVCSPHVGPDGAIVGAIATVSEVTARRRGEAALRRSEARYRRLFEESRDAILVTTPDGRVLDANAAAVELLGRSRRELLAAGTLELWADGADRVRLMTDLDRSGSIREREVVLRRSDGQVVTCLLSSIGLRDAAGEIVSYQSILHDVTLRKAAEEQLLHAGLHDALTALPNRALFLDRADHLVKRAARRPSESFALLFLDVDRFRYVNESLGHPTGDQLLMAVARRIESCLRQEDTVARFGGDEFAVLLESIGDPADAVRVAERIQDELARPIVMGEQEVFATASIGIVPWAPGYARAEEMLRDADTAMNRAKVGGRARHEIFAEEMHADVVARLRLETQLRHAVERGQMVLHYQPIVGLESGQLAGFEALVRWAHPARGLLAPAEFIGLAEETGLIVPIGSWVLREACSQLRRWQDDAPEAGDLTMNVNLSARQFLQPDLIEDMDVVLAETSVDPRSLAVEITESVFLENAEASGRVLRQLRDRGVRVCIDDFGTGYSSLGYLRRFPVDSLKIDRSFVSGLDAEGGNPKLVRAIISLAQSLELTAIAEGVETAAQRRIVREMGARLGQGHLFASALDARHATELLARPTAW